MTIFCQWVNCNFNEDGKCCCEDDIQLSEETFVKEKNENGKVMIYEYLTCDNYFDEK